MLTRLGLRNFKAFGDEMEYAPLAPITLIYGPNSSGKSSIVQALLMLNQSLAAAERRAAMKLVPRGDYVDLGSVEAFIHNHETSRTFEIEVSVQEWASPLRRGELYFPVTTAGLAFSATTADDAHQLNTIQLRLEKIDQSGREGFDMQFERSSDDESDESISFRWGNDSSIKSFVRYIKKNIDTDESQINLPSRSSVRRALDKVKAMSSEDMESHLQNFQFEPMQGLRFRLVESSRYAHEADGLMADVVDIPVFEMRGVRSELNRLSHIGPHRNAPQRAYEAYGRIRRDTAGERGEFTPHILGSEEDIVESTNMWFDKCEIPYRLEVRSQKGDILTGDRTVLALSDKREGDVKQLTLTDVGFGINQILPVIVEGVIAWNRTICVEQPEIHLHPRLQANIADLLIETSCANENYEGNQWIVETHSEMIIRRLQTRIREGAISSEDVSVLYVDPQDDGSSTIQQLRLDENGYWLDDWPDGFFDESVEEARNFRRASKVRN